MITESSLFSLIFFSQSQSIRFLFICFPPLCINVFGAKSSLLSIKQCGRDNDIFLLGFSLFFDCSTTVAVAAHVNYTVFFLDLFQTGNIKHVTSCVAEDFTVKTYQTRVIVKCGAKQTFRNVKMLRIITLTTQKRPLTDLPLSFARSWFHRGNSDWPLLTPSLLSGPVMSLLSVTPLFSPLLDTFFCSFLPTYPSDANLLSENTSHHSGASARH